METPKSPPTQPTGFSFAISDLVMAQGWSEFHDLRMVVELDYCADGEVFEEVLAFYPHDRSSRRWIMWRTRHEVVMQPMLGRATRFGSMAEALEHTIRVADEIGNLKAV